MSAAHAGADYIGLNVVLGTPRALELSRAAELAHFARALPAAPEIVLVTADLPPAELATALATVDPDVIQLSGNEALTTLPRRTWKTIRATDRALEEAKLWMAAGCERILLDAAHATMLGGTGQSADREIALTVAREVPVILAGGLRPSTVAQSVLDVPAVGVDVASGVEIAGTKPPRKDPLAVALFVKRAKAARFDRPTSPARPQPVAPTLLEADARGRWGTDARFRRPICAGNADVGAARARAHLLRAARRPNLLGRAARAEHPLRRPTHTDLSRRPSCRSAGPRYSAVSEARGSGTYRRAQNQQRAWPGPACQAAGQDPPDRGNRRRPARRGHRHRCRAAWAAVCRLHGRARHRAPAPERAAHERAGRRGAVGRSPARRR